MMNEKIRKRCYCGNKEDIYLTDELKDELDMNGYVIMYCSECGNELDLQDEDL